MASRSVTFFRRRRWSLWSAVWDTGSCSVDCMSVSLMSSIDLGTVLYTGDADRVDLVAHKMHFFQLSRHSFIPVVMYVLMRKWFL